MSDSFLRREIAEALRSFEGVRSGDRENFREAVGLVDDGSAHSKLVTPANVDEYEAGFRRIWSGQIAEIANDTRFPVDAPDALYGRGLDGESDIYVVQAGPNAEIGWATTILFHVEVSTGEPIDPDGLSEHMSTSAHADPQPPRLLTYAEMNDRVVSYEAARAQADSEQAQALGLSTGVASSSLPPAA